MSKEFGAFITQTGSSCTGCRACEIACFAAHTGGSGKTVGTVTVPVVPRLFVTTTEEGCTSVRCRHCEDAPCLNACQHGAISRVEGQVILDTAKCGGCTQPVCAESCPFGAIRLLPHAAKCDLCAVQEDGPACVRACPNQVLRYVNLPEEREARNARAARFLSYLT